MLKDMKITRKFPLIMITFALLSALTTGIVAYYQAANTMQEQAKAKLFSLLESRESALRNYFNIIQADIIYHSQSKLIQNALADFSDAWRQLNSEQQTYLQQQYIANNPYKKGQKSSLLAAQDSSVYTQVHARYHTDFMALVEARSFYDIFLIDKYGNLIYTISKESDFATNLRDGPWANTGLSKIYQSIQANPKMGQYLFADFESYKPSHGHPASFIAAPVFGANNQYLGVLAFQISIDELDAIMQVTAGMGFTGETYLVGEDLLMRSNSRFYNGRSILQLTVDTQPVHHAFAGEEGVDISMDYRQQPAFSAYKPFDFFNTRWALIAEIDKVEVLEPVYQLNRLLTISGAIIAVAITVIGYLLAADLSNPIMSMTRIMKQLARNDLSVNISVNERKDEVGDMAFALMQFKNSALEKEKLREHLSHMAKHDSLTGLPNRDFVITHLEHLMTTGSHFSIMFVDLDSFKQVNDNGGHLIGDQLLQEVSRRFTSCLHSDDVVARLGGDEFLIILPNTRTKAECLKVAEKLLKTTAEAFYINHQEIKISASMGATTYSEKTANSSELLGIADKAMYQAKAKGNNVVYLDMATFDNQDKFV